MGESGGQPNESIVERASRGDERALEQAFATWLPALEGFLRRRAPREVLAHESASDLAQSVFREALVRLGRGDLEYRGDAQLRRWLYRASELKLQNRRRYWAAEKREGRAAEVAGALSDPDLRARLRERITSPSEAAMRRENVQRFDEALAALDERQRAVVVLFHIEGLSHAEIAVALSIEEGHSRTILARSLARLTRLLRDREERGFS